MKKINHVKPVNDRFRKRRGGTHKLYIINCGQCESEIMIYQKDGQGNLHRLYIDRILQSVDPRITGDFQNKKDVPRLECPSEDCENIIGHPMLYSKDGENRLAYRLVGPIKKSLIDEM
jgi:hypothetical protein